MMNDRPAEGRAWRMSVKPGSRFSEKGRRAEPRLERVTIQSNRELDDLPTAVGATRDGRAFAVPFHHFRPRVQAQLARLGLGPAAAEV